MAPRPRRAGRAARRLLISLALVSLSHPAAWAHQNRHVGPIELTVGWLEEPPLAGFKNGVEVAASRAGQPVEGGRLQLVLVFGGRNSATRSEPMSLEPLPEEQGAYFAPVIPTRPGKYTFLITGRLGGRRVHEVFTSLDEVRNPGEAEFPARDPTPAELTARLDRLDTRVREVLSEIAALRANAGVDAPMWILAGAGLALGALALAVALLRGGARRT